MKPTLIRRVRNRSAPSRSEATIFKKESQESFFGNAEQSAFFQPSVTVQRKCEHCEEEEKKVQRMEDKKEEEKIMKKEDQKEEEQVQRQPEKKEEEKLQRAEEKKEEENIQKKEANTGTATGNSVGNYIGSLNGKGQPLSVSTNHFFSSRMGYNFGNVKVHTDKEATESAKGINAKAYTTGNNVVFNEGQYDTTSTEGKRLIAHELTHVMQQDDGDNNIQRAPGDKHDLTSAQLSGNTKLEECFDREGKIGKPEKGDHVKKIQEALIQLGISLPKFGADSDYGTETANGVKEFQQKAGMSKDEWDGIVGRKTIGLMDMSLRNNNTISKDPDANTTDFVVHDPKKKESSCEPKEDPCPSPNTDVDSEADKAIKLIDKVISTQLPPKNDGRADYPAIFSTLFRNNDARDISFKVAEVKKGYEDTKNFIGLLKTDKSHVRCGNSCDDGCKAGAPAYHNNANGKHIITFCPSFKTDPEKTVIVLHESHHAGVGSKDIAYPHTRLIDKLDHAKALLNAASFHLYAALVEDPKSDIIGPKTKDTDSLANAAQKKNIDLALAFMQQWFSLVTHDMSIVSGDIEDAKRKGNYSTARSADVIDRVYVKWFGVTPTSRRPVTGDVNKAKAIMERSEKMEKAFSKPFTISDSKDISEWQRGPGTEIKLNQQLLGLDMKRMVIGLLQELVHATEEISAESEPLYVGLINDLRNERSLDPQ